MNDSILSIAVMEPFPGCEEEFLTVLHELYTLMQRKAYSENTLLRNRLDPPHYINVRRWNSVQAREDAHEDPEVHQYWARLGHLCFMRRVHEILDEVNWKAIATGAED
jgi:hypothetical protein